MIAPCDGKFWWRMDRPPRLRNWNDTRQLPSLPSFRPTFQQAGLNGRITGVIFLGHRFHSGVRRVCSPEDSCRSFLLASMHVLCELAFQYSFEIERSYLLWWFKLDSREIQEHVWVNVSMCVDKFKFGLLLIEFEEEGWMYVTMIRFHDGELKKRKYTRVLSELKFGI